MQEGNSKTCLVNKDGRIFLFFITTKIPHVRSYLVPILRQCTIAYESYLQLHEVQKLVKAMRNGPT